MCSPERLTRLQLFVRCRAEFFAENDLQGTPNWLGSPGSASTAVGTRNMAVLGSDQRCLVFRFLHVHHSHPGIQHCF